MKEKESQPTSKSPMRQWDNLLDETLVYTGNHSMVTVFDLISYNNTHVTHTAFNDIDSLMQAIQPDRINWIIVHGLSEIEKITEFGHRLKISRLWLQDIVNARDSAKIEHQHKQLLTLIDHYSVKEDGSVEKQHCSLFLSTEYVIWFQEDGQQFFKEIVKAIKSNRGKVRSNGTDYLFNLILSHEIDQYLMLLDKERNHLSDIEDDLLDVYADTRDSMNQIQKIRKEYLLLRKSILPFKECFNKLMDEDLSLISSENKSYFKDTQDHIQQVYLLIDNTKEMISSLVELAMSNNDRKLNYTMNKLTIVSVIFIPLTFLAGVWGMNYAYMPFLDWKYGYLVAWLIFILVAIIVILILKKKKWF